MKYHILSLTKDILAEAINYLFIVMLWVTFSGAAGTRLPVLWAFGLFLYCLFLYVIRKFINSIVLFTAIHLGTMVLICYLFSGNLRETAVFIFVMLAITIKSFAVRLNSEAPGEKAIKGVVAGIFTIVAMGLLTYLQQYELRDILPKLSLVFITLFLLHYYLDKFIWFDFMNRKIITHMPTGSLFKAGAPLVAGLSGFYLIVASICINEELVNRLSWWIRSKILGFLRWIGSLLPETVDETVTEPVPSETFTFNNTAPELAEIQEPSVVAQAIEKFFIYLTVVVIVAAVLTLICYLVYSLIKRFKGIEKVSEVELNADYVEEREKLKRTEKHREQRHVLPSASDRIRNMYKRLAEKNKDTVVDPARLSAREFADRFEGLSKENALEFAYIYEKARYSPDICTKEDVKRAKGLIADIR